MYHIDKNIGKFYIDVICTHGLVLGFVNIRYCCRLGVERVGCLLGRRLRIGGGQLGCFLVIFVY